MADGFGLADILDVVQPVATAGMGAVSKATDPSLWSGLWSGLKGGVGTLGDVAKTALPIAQLGATGYGIASGVQAAGQLAEQTKITKRAAEMQERVAGEATAAAAPAREFARTEFERAAAGKIDPAIQARIDLWAQGAKQQAMDYLARAGLSDSSTAQSWLAWIDKQAEAMKAEALQGQQALALQATGTATGALAAAGGAAGAEAAGAQAQQQDLTQLIASANEQLAKLSAGAA